MDPGGDVRFPPFLRVISPISTRHKQEVFENRGVRKFCMGSQIHTDLWPYISIIPVFGCLLPEASRLFFPFLSGLVPECNTVARSEIL